MRERKNHQQRGETLHLLKGVYHHSQTFFLGKNLHVILFIFYFATQSTFKWKKIGQSLYLWMLGFGVVQMVYGLMIQRKG